MHEFSGLSLQNTSDGLLFRTDHCLQFSQSPPFPLYKKFFLLLLGLLQFDSAFLLDVLSSAAIRFDWLLVLQQIKGRNIVLLFLPVHFLGVDLLGLLLALVLPFEEYSWLQNLLGFIELQFVIFSERKMRKDLRVVHIRLLR